MLVVHFDNKLWPAGFKGPTGKATLWWSSPTLLPLHRILPVAGRGSRGRHLCFIETDGTPHGPTACPPPQLRRGRDPLGLLCTFNYSVSPSSSMASNEPRALSWVAYNSCRASSPQVLMDFLCLESFCGLFAIGLIILSNFESYCRSLKRQMKCWFKIFL